MKSKNVCLAFLSLVLSLSCTSVPDGPDYHKHEVVERLGDKDETPEWALGGSAMLEDKGDVVFIQTASMSGDARTDACLRAASDTGRAEILRHIKDNVTTSGQVNDVSVSGDPAVESLTAFLAQGKLSGVHIQEKYWEKRVESDSSGQRVLRVHCAAKVAIAKSELSRQLQAALGNGGNAEIRKSLLEAQQKFLDNVDTEVN